MIVSVAINEEMNKCADNHHTISRSSVEVQMLNVLFYFFMQEMLGSAWMQISVFIIIITKKPGQSSFILKHWR